MGNLSFAAFVLRAEQTARPLGKRMSEHYRWDAKRQQWKLDRIELALIIAAIASIIALFAVTLALR
jgi:hypothetical protein